jgi:hypothetical protein
MKKNIIQKIKKLSNEKYNYINNLLDLNKKYITKFLNVDNKKMIGIFLDKKIILLTEYYVYGIYQPYTKLWIWASSIPGIDIKNIKNIQKIKSFNYLFENNDDPKYNFYYQFLTQDVIYISDIKLLKWIKDLILYLSNDIWCFTPSNSEQNYQFITISKIKEKYI